MYETLFHPAFWMPTLLAIVGVAVFIYGNARVQTRVRTAGLGVVALTAVWCVVAYAVNTPIEQCVDRTRAICAATESGKWDQFKPLIDKNTVIDHFNFRGPEVITNVVQQNAEGFKLTAIRIVGTDVTTGAGTYDVTISTLLDGAQPTPARFTFQYEQRSDGILLSHIVPVSVGSMSVEEFQKYVLRSMGMPGR